MSWHFQIGGLVILAVGLWTVIDKAFFEDLLKNNLFLNAAYVLIATGCLSVTIASFGFYGAVKRVKCLLFTYFMLVLALFIIIILGGVLSYVFRAEIKHHLKGQLINDIPLYNPDSGWNGVTRAWDITQTQVRSPEGLYKTGLSDFF